MEKTSKTSAFIQAARLRTLPLAVSGILMGSACAYLNNIFSFSLPVMVLGLLTAILLQVLSNFANDYGDFQKGTDQFAKRTDRTLIAGILSPKEMYIGIWVAALLSFVSGMSLLYIALPELDLIFFSFIVLGLSAIAAAIKYTVGKKAYGYRGMGDLFVLIFFGIVAVGGIYFLHTGELHIEILLAAMCVGLLSTGVLNVNNIRDIESDKKSGKTTLPVRLGKKRAITYQTFLVIFGLISIVLYFTILPMLDGAEFDWQITGILLTVFLPFLVFLANHITALKAAVNREEYNKQLKFLSLLTFSLSAYTWVLAFLMS